MMAETKEKNKKSEVWRVLKFVLFSISAGVIELVSYTLLDKFTNWPYWPCYLIALVLSVLWNFTFNRKFTFKSANNVPVAMLKVFCYYLVFTPATTLLGAKLSDGIIAGAAIFHGLGVPGIVVTLINMGINLTTEFLYQRYFVFRDTIDTNDVAKKQAEKAKAAEKSDKAE